MVIFFFFSNMNENTMKGHIVHFLESVSRITSQMLRQYDGFFGVVGTYYYHPIIMIVHTFVYPKLCDL